MTAPTAITSAAEPVDAGAVRGPRAILEVCLRCLGVLAVVNIPAVAVVGLVAGLRGANDGLVGEGLRAAVGGSVYAGMAWVVAIIPVMLVGWPAGLLTAHLLRRQRREWTHVAVFALVGAVLCPVMIAFAQALGGNSVGGPLVLVLAAVGEGALGAGGGRWWTGRGRRRRVADPLAAGGSGSAVPASEGSAVA
ncbi:hypothetical protein [Cellulomonas sp. URHE0023]|uniref:hypothetical protein n=1 Tax=Cellulomonas sp. URHE0023 TaxID=1380354 RepID=UPI000482CDE0|nr:hypothetical protein [Cellulomonas sp. URHE0023]